MPALKRVENWPELHSAFIEERRYLPFAWGSNDCALFPADGVLRITGVDLAIAWRGYTTEAGAARRIREAGGLVGFTRELREKAIGLAQRSDIVIANCEDRETFGLYIGSGYWAAPGPTGLVFRPMAEALRVFEV